MGLVPAGYWPDTYWAKNYWLDNYWPLCNIEWFIARLLSPGYWPTTYWPSNFWSNSYWQDYSITAISPTVIRKAYTVLARNYDYTVVR